MDIRIEVFFSTLTHEGAICAREEFAANGEDPLALVQARYRELFPGDPGLQTADIESSSWHYDAASHSLVLTYLVHGLELTVAALPGAAVIDVDTLRSPNTLSRDPLAPHRSDISALSIYRHGIRHLDLQSRGPGTPVVHAADAQSSVEPLAIDIEVFFTRLNGDTFTVTATRITQRLSDITDPTESVLAQYVALFPDRAAERGDTLVHSTSWRYDAAGNAVVLTYLIEGAELDVRRAGETAEVSLAQCAEEWRRFDTSAPQHSAAALAHGISHLALLAGHDPAVAAVVNRTATTRAALSAIGAAPSGELRAFTRIK